MARLALLCFASLLTLQVYGVPLSVQRPATSHSHANSVQGRKSSETLHPIGRCDAKDNIFKSGQTYEYKYFGKAETGLGFANGKSVGLAMDCHVKLAVPASCEYRLKVESCEVFEHDASESDQDKANFRTLEDEVMAMEGREASKRGFKRSDRSEEFSRQVTQHAIQAQIANGEVIRVIHEESEETWVVNFKKAILDALQVRSDADTQRDYLIMQNGIHGLCPTKFSSKSSQDSIIEEKDLDSCIHSAKNNWELSPLMPFWNMSFVSKIMKAESVCAYKLQRERSESASHITSMTCRETHRFLPVPWNSHISAVSANITQTLRFIKKESQSEEMDRQLAAKTVTSILYDHENATDVNRKDGSGDSVELLEDLMKKAKDGFDIDAPAAFDDFVNELRDSSNLDDVIVKADQGDKQEKEIAKYLLVQGLVQCNAPACLRALTTLMQSEAIPRAVFEPVVMALALTKQQDPVFLAEITRMCEAKPSRTCALLVGALTYQMVSIDEDLLEDQESQESLKTAVDFLIDLIDDDKCEASDKLDKMDEDSDATKLIVALKALGNLGDAAEKVQSASSSSGRSSGKEAEKKIIQCIKDKKTADNVTMAAIHAVRRLQPSQHISDSLLSVLADHGENHDVRMAACMVSVRMASDRSAVRNIIKTMEVEKSQHVKSFMVSHLRSVLKSEDPNYVQTAELIKSVLEERGQSLPQVKVKIPNSLHIELSKFYEIPFLDNEDNDIGAQIEGSIMFTPKSYIARALHVNVSTQIWGEYVNLLEAGVHLEGVDDLVEKVIGPNGYLTKSKLLVNAQEKLKEIVKFIESIAYKYFRAEDVQEYIRKVMTVLKTDKFEEILDKVLETLQQVDTGELSRLFQNLRDVDVQKVIESIKRNMPQSLQLDKVVEKLKRIKLTRQDISKETLVEALEAFGISGSQSRQVLSQLNEYGVNVDQIVEYLKHADLEAIKDNLKNLRINDVQNKVASYMQAIMEFLNQIAKKYNLPDLSTLLDMTKKAYNNPSEIHKVKDEFIQRRRENSNSRTKKSGSDEDYTDDNEDDEETNDHASLDHMPWGRHVKNSKNRGISEDDDQEVDDDELEITAFLRIFGNELGFISLSDITKILDLEKIKKSFNMQRMQGYWNDVVDGFEIQPSFAGKIEGLHHISTGLGLPLQLTLNVTGIATVHIKFDPEGSNFRKSSIEFEPSGALQIAGGMSIDIPSIHTIATVSNTTVKSEFEVKLQVDIKRDTIDINIQKPDEELDIIHIRHEVKLVKDDEDYSPFEEGKSNEVKKQKCLPSAVERAIGLKLCAHLETSTISGSSMLSHGPHELRVSLQESPQSGLDHIKISGKREQRDEEGRYEMSVSAPSNSQRLQREAKAVVTHDRRNNHVNLRAYVPDDSSLPRIHVFIKNLAATDSEMKFGVETGIDVELADEKHYNASVTVLAKADGYGSSYRTARIGDTYESVQFNYTVAGSLQSPLVAVNVSTTTAKFGTTLFMEHNLTYYISNEVKIPLLKKLRFPGAEQRNGVSKFSLRHGIKMASDRTAIDLQAKVKFTTFPRLDVAEPTIYHVSQIKVHRDYRHIGLHSNTTWLNQNDEIEFLNSSLTINNIIELPSLREPIHYKVNISRNDWNVAVDGEVKKSSSGQHIMKHKFSGFAMLPEESSLVQSVILRLRADLKSIASIAKLRSSSASLRPHKTHKLRAPEHSDESVTYQPKQIVATVEHTFQKKSSNSDAGGSWAKHRAFKDSEEQQDGSSGSRSRNSQRDEEQSNDNSRSNKVATHRKSSRDDTDDTSDLCPMRQPCNTMNAYELVTKMALQMSGSATKELTATTTVGSDAHERQAVVSLWLLHDTSSTGTEYGFGHVAHLRLSKSDGLLMLVNSTVDKSGREQFALDAFMKLNPMHMEMEAYLDVKSPEIEASGNFRVSTPSNKQVTVQISTKSECQSYEALSHEFKSTIKLGLGKVGQSVRFRHAKVDTNFQIQFDLFGQGDFQDTRDDDDFDDDTMSNGNQGSSRSWMDRSSSTQNNRRSSQRSSDDESNHEDTDNSQQQSGSRGGQRSQSSHRMNSQRNADDEQNSDVTENNNRQGSSKSREESRRRLPRAIHGRESERSSRTQESRRTEVRYSNARQLQRTSHLGSSRVSSRDQDGSGEEQTRSRSSSQSSRQQSHKSISRSNDNDSQENSRRRDSSSEENTDRNSGYGKQGRRGTPYTSQHLKQTFAAFKPELKSTLRVKSMDRQYIPTFTVETKLTTKRSVVEVDIHEVPRSLESILISKKFSLQGEIQDTGASIKLIVTGRGEVGAEVKINGQREMTTKIYDHNILKNGETVHAEVTVTLPTESTISTKIYINPESTTQISRKISQNLKSYYEVSYRIAKEVSERALSEARSIWNDQNHPAYKFIKPFVRGSMADWKNQLLSTLAQSYVRTKDNANSMYSDSSLFGTSLEQMIRTINHEQKKWMQYILELLKGTPAGEWVEAVPTFEEFTSKITEVTERHFGEQMRVIKSRQDCIMMKSCDSIAALRSLQEVAVELTNSLDPARAREMAEAATETIKELLLSAIKSLQLTSQHNKQLKALLDTVDLKALEQAIRDTKSPDLENIMSGLKAVAVLAKSLAVSKLESVAETQNGALIITIPHPFHWTDMKDFPKLTENQRKQSSEFFAKSKQAWKDLSEEGSFSIPSSYNDEESSTNYRLKNILKVPKHNMASHSAMIFEHHVATFDGKVYAIPKSAEECTYLMARGARKENFALVKSKDGITLTLPEMSITITKENEVRLNNSRTAVQLPVESASKRTQIRLVGEHIEVESATGISLKCNGEKKLCLVHVSSGMWGESSGLLGTNNNEQSDDWKTPSGKANHVEDFLNEYELSKTSKCRLSKDQEFRRPGQECPKSTKCAMFFRSKDSELKNCFSTVEPAEFLTACETESKICTRAEAEEAVCNVVAAYRELCSANGVDTEAPEACETCDGRKENSIWNIRGNKGKVDVVVVVSEHKDFMKSSRQAPSEKIRSIMESVNRKLQQSGGQDVRVALVGYSGAGVHKDGHTHTVESKQFDTMDKLGKALRSLEFKGQEKKDILETLDFIVASHDFRPEATKLMLVFGPTDSEISAGGSRTHKVQEELTKRGITLTVFAKYDELKERDLGVNFDGTLLTGKSSGKGAQQDSHSSSSQTGEMPQRQLSKLAKATRGAIFKVDSLLSEDSAKLAQLEERAAAMISEQVKREESMCRSCKCEESELKQLIAVCKPAQCRA